MEQAAISVCDAAFIFFSAFFHVCTKGSLSHNNWTISLFSNYVFSSNPFPSLYSAIALLLQLLVGATTRGLLVSSSPRAGQATTKTP